MSQEKKPRKTVAKKGATKKSVEAPIAEMAAAAPVSDSPVRKTRTKTAVNTKAKSLQVNIDDIIRLRAYEIYLQRGATPGNPHEDWQVAEREVRAHFGQEADA
jgi:hypothetical protein